MLTRTYGKGRYFCYDLADRRSADCKSGTRKWMKQKSSRGERRNAHLAHSVASFWEQIQKEKEDENNEFQEMEFDWEYAG